MAVQLPSDTITREAATGLAAHLNLVLQLPQKLGTAVTSETWLTTVKI